MDIFKDTGTLRSRQLYNACLEEAMKRLGLVSQSKECQEIILLSKGKELTDSTGFGA